MDDLNDAFSISVAQVNKSDAHPRVSTRRQALVSVDPLNLTGQRKGRFTLACSKPERHTGPDFEGFSTGHKNPHLGDVGDLGVEKRVLSDAIYRPLDAEPLGSSPLRILGVWVGTAAHPPPIAPRTTGVTFSTSERAICHRDSLKTALLVAGRPA